MTKLEEIEQAIAALPSTDLAKLHDWFYDFEAAKWDEQIEQDAKSGKLDDMARQAVEDHAAGETTEI